MVAMGGILRRSTWTLFLLSWSCIHSFRRFLKSPMSRWRVRSLQESDGPLIKPPFVIDISSHEMLMGPGIESFKMINKEKMKELTEIAGLSHQPKPFPELQYEELDMKTVTKQWMAYCLALNKSTDVKAYDIQDVISACMKKNTLCHIVDEEQPVEEIDTVFVTDRELRRIHQERTKSNRPMSREDMLHALLSIADEDVKFVEPAHLFDDDECYPEYSNPVDIKSALVPAEDFFGPKPACQVPVRVFEGTIVDDVTEFITLPELARAWELRLAAPLGLPSDKEFDPKTALLLLSNQDDEEDVELVDGPIEYVEARSIPLTNRRYEELLSSISDERIREYVRGRLEDLDDQQYLYNHPPRSSLSPDVESQRLVIESFMHSKHPLQHRIPAQWDDPEESEWADSEMYQLASQMTLPGEPRVDFSQKSTPWEKLGLKEEDIYPESGRFMDYIRSVIKDKEQLELPPVVQWSIQMHSEAAAKSSEPAVQQPQPMSLLVGNQSFGEVSDSITLADLLQNTTKIQELEKATALSPSEQALLDEKLVMDGSATYFDDLAIATVGFEDEASLEVAHPDSPWMQYKRAMERRLDRLEQMEHLPADYLLEELEADIEEEIEAEEESELGREFHRKLAEAEQTFVSILGDEEHLGDRVAGVVDTALQEVEAWSGSVNDSTNFLHPRILRPAFDLSERYTKFHLRQRQRQVEEEYRESLAFAEANDETLPMAPQPPSELDYYNNDPSVMETVQMIHEVTRDPDFEEEIDTMDNGIQKAWREYWGKERSTLLDGIKRSLIPGTTEIEGEHLWRNIENRNYFASFEISDDDQDEDEEASFASDESGTSTRRNGADDDYTDEEYSDEDYDEDEDEDGAISAEREIAMAVERDRERGVHEPDDTYPSQYYPPMKAVTKGARVFNSNQHLQQGMPSLDSLQAELESLKLNVRDVAEDIGDFQLPFADLESQELAYDPQNRRIPEIESDLSSEFEYNPWMDVYHWETNRNRWNQGYYKDGCFKVPPSWLNRPELEDMVGHEVWSNYDRRLIFDWQDAVLDDDVYHAYAVKQLHDLTDLYLPNHREISKELDTQRSWNRYLEAKAKDPSVTYPVKEPIPRSFTPDIDRGIEYTDELFELKHGRKLGTKYPPLEEQFANDSFELATDTVVENNIGTMHENYYWKPLQNVTHEVEPEKEQILKPIIDYINFLGKLVSTKDDLIIFEYYGPMKHILGLQGSLEYMAKQIYPATKKLRLETDRDSDDIRTR